MKVEIKYICEICRKEYENELEAKLCEDKCKEKQIICNQCVEYNKHPQERPCCLCANFIYNKLTGYKNYFTKEED